MTLKTKTDISNLSHHQEAIKAIKKEKLVFMNIQIAESIKTAFQIEIKRRKNVSASKLIRKWIEEYLEGRA